MNYEPASTGPAAEHCQPGTTALYGACLAWHPSFRPLGCYNDRSIRGSFSPSLHRDGRAFDCGIATGEAHSIDAMDRLCVRLVEAHEALGVQQVIFNAEYWRVGNADWRPFTGSSGPHYDHAHIELTIEKSQSLDYATVAAVLAGLPEDEEPMSPEDYQGIADAILNKQIRTRIEVSATNPVGVEADLSLGTLLSYWYIEFQRANKP